MPVKIAPIPIVLLDNDQIIVDVVAMIQLSLTHGFVFKKSISFSHRKCYDRVNFKPIFDKSHENVDLELKMMTVYERFIDI